MLFRVRLGFGPLFGGCDNQKMEEGRYRFRLAPQDENLRTFLDSLAPRERNRWIRDALAQWYYLKELLAEIRGELQAVSLKQEQLSKEIAEIRREFQSIRTLLESGKLGQAVRGGQEQEGDDMAELEAKIDRLTKNIEGGWGL